MRKGDQTCMARANSGKIEVTAEWGSPCAGAHYIATPLLSIRIGLAGCVLRILTVLSCKPAVQSCGHRVSIWMSADGRTRWLAGSVKETYTSPEPGVLRVDSITRVGEQVQRGLQIYRKQEQ